MSVAFNRFAPSAFFLALLAFSGFSAPLSAADTTYGEGVQGTEVVLVSELLTHPDAWVGKTVRVEGLITDVCKKRGCWIAIAGDREFETLRFKVKDGVIVFPVDVKGHRAVVEGVFARFEISEEDAIAKAKHHAEETGEPFDPSTIKGPQVVYQIEGIGAVVK